MTNERQDEPFYVISIAGRMVGMHAQTLRGYERAGLLAPWRSRGQRRLYSNADIARLRAIRAGPRLRRTVGSDAHRDQTPTDHTVYPHTASAAIDRAVRDLDMRLFTRREETPVGPAGSIRA